MAFLGQGMNVVSSGGSGAAARRNLVNLWIVVYAFVGSQMAWTLRPFVGAPSMRFELFRQLGGNFYFSPSGCRTLETCVSRVWRESGSRGA